MRFIGLTSLELGVYIFRVFRTYFVFIKMLPITGFNSSTDKRSFTFLQWHVPSKTTVTLSLLQSVSSKTSEGTPSPPLSIVLICYSISREFTESFIFQSKTCFTNRRQTISTNFRWLSLFFIHRIYFMFSPMFNPLCYSLPF